MISEAQDTFSGEFPKQGIPLGSQFPHLTRKPEETTKKASKNSSKGFVRRLWDGLFKNQPQTGQENTLQNTTSGSKSKKMENITQEPQVFQWIKGDYEGKLVNVIDTFVEDNIEWLIFQDGTQCNSALIGEFIAPVPPGSQPPLPIVSGMAPRKPAPAPIKKEQPVSQPVIQSTPVSGHPIHDLLRMSKKKKVKLEITIGVDMPSEDLLKVMIGEFPDGADIIGDYLVSTINQEDMMNQIKNLLKARIKQVNTKKNPTKNENPS
jgi:hypothetical protein